MRHRVASGGGRVAADTQYSIVDKGQWQDLPQTIWMIPCPGCRRTHVFLHLFVLLPLFASGRQAVDRRCRIAVAGSCHPEMARTRSICGGRCKAFPDHRCRDDQAPSIHAAGQTPKSPPGPAEQLSPPTPEAPTLFYGRKFIYLKPALDFDLLGKGRNGRGTVCYGSPE